MISKKVFRGEHRWAAMILSALLLVVLGAAIYGGAYVYVVQNDRCCDCTRVMEMVPVLKANQPIRAGQPFHPEMVTIEEVPVRFLPPRPILEADLMAYEGLTLLVDIQEGAMLLESDFEKTGHPDSGFE